MSKRVLLLVRSLRLGGMERMTVNLANAMAEQGHRVDILVFKKRLDLQPDSRVKVHCVDFDRLFRLTIVGALYELIARGVFSRFSRRSRNILHSIYFSPLFRMWIRREEQRSGRRFDLIVARGFGSFQGLAFCRDPRLVRVVVNELWAPADGLWDRLFYRRSFDGAKIFFNSSSVQEGFRQVCHRERIAPSLCRLVRNPTDLMHIRRESRKPVDFPHPFLLNVGRLEKAKNQSLLLKAFARASHQIPHELVIIGKGSLEKALRAEAVELNIAHRVHFLGELTNPYQWMARADLFVLSSLHEGLPNVVIESFACGTPAVVTRGHGGAAELMRGDLAAYVAEPTPESLSDRITAALTARPMVDNAFIDSFSAERVAAEFLSAAER